MFRPFNPFELDDKAWGVERPFLLRQIIDMDAVTPRRCGCGMAELGGEEGSPGWDTDPL